MSARGNAALSGDVEPHKPSSMALKAGPETPQNLMVRQIPGAILTLCVAGCIPELISKVFICKKRQILAVHTKSHLRSFQCLKMSPRPWAWKNLTICAAENVVESTEVRTYQSLQTGEEQLGQMRTTRRAWFSLSVFRSWFSPVSIFAICHLLPSV